MAAGDSHGITWDELADWWAGEVDPARSEEIEEHLLACGSCAERGRRVGDLARGIEGIGRAGAVSGVAMPALVGRLERDGVRVHRYRIAPGQVVPCSVWPDDEVMAAVLDVRALAGEEGRRFDLLASFEGGPALRVADVPLDRAHGTLTWLTPASAERQRPATRVSFQVIRVTADGESVACEYALAHEPWTGPASPR